MENVTAFTTIDLALMQSYCTMLVKSDMIAFMTILRHASFLGQRTDIVVKQTGQEGCLHTVEIQTEIQV